MRQLLQIAANLLQNATVITKCKVYYKLRQYTPLFPFSTIQNISVSVKSSSSTSVFFKAAFHANPGAEINFPGSN